MRHPDRRGSPLSLTPDPVRRICVPLVARIGNRAERGFDVVPTPLVLQRSPDHLCDERAAPSRACPPVELGYQIIIERYVQSHVLMIAHRTGSL